MDEDKAIEAKDMVPGVVYRSIYNDRHSYTREGKNLACVESGRVFPIDNLGYTKFYPCPNSNEE